MEHCLSCALALCSVKKPGCDQITCGMGPTHPFIILDKRQGCSCPMPSLPCLVSLVLTFLFLHSLKALIFDEYQTKKKQNSRDLPVIFLAVPQVPSHKVKLREARHGRLASSIIYILQVTLVSLHLFGYKMLFQWILLPQNFLGYSIHPRVLGVCIFVRGWENRYFKNENIVFFRIHSGDQRNH